MTKIELQPQLNEIWEYVDQVKLGMMDRKHFYDLVGLILNTVEVEAKIQTLKDIRL